MPIHLDISNRVATVTIDLPPVNALTEAAFREITAIFEQLGERRDVSVAVLAATGKVFCAGVDLADSARRNSGVDAASGPAADQLDAGLVVRSCFWSILECKVPVIAAVNGAATGAGLALVACSDIIICSDNARFAVTEINVGVLGGGRFLQRMVGPYKQRQMFFSGEWVPAEEFHRLGSVEKVVAPEDLLPTAMQYASVIASKSPIGLRLAKESLNRVEFLTLQDGYRLEQEYTARLTRFNDSAEARKSFMEKRDPDWSWS